MLTLYSLSSGDLSRMIRAGISLRSDYVNVFETISEQLLLPYQRDLSLYYTRLVLFFILNAISYPI